MSVDRPIPEDDAIRAAHPTRSGRHDLYAEAMRLVGAKHSKYALVDLVNWLLLRLAGTSEAAASPVTRNDFRELVDPGESKSDASASDAAGSPTQEWRRVYSWVLERTGIELHPEYGSDWWFVVDASDFDKALSDALPFEQAKASAERLARERRPTQSTPKKEPDR